MVKPWVKRYPLIDGHGNFGSIDGDGAAAMRYSEMRLTKIAEEGILLNLKKENVEMQLNYDDKEYEPITLPCLFPNLLCNATEGIGYSVACQWQPHNLTEVLNGALAYLEKDGDISVEELMEYIQGPDFPLGGTVINQKDLLQVYKTGKGKAIVRANYTVKQTPKGAIITFKEIPFGTTTENVLKSIDKAFKEDKLFGLSDVSNDGDKNGIKIVIELEKDVDAEQFLDRLFQNTILQTNLPFNQYACIENENPKLYNLYDAIKAYVEHQKIVIQKEAAFDLKKAKARLEIVEGLIIALENIDNIIKIIRGSKSAAEAKVKLVELYKFSETQVKAVVDMKLASLANLESVEINTEKNNLISKISDLESIISNPNSEALKSRIIAFRDKFGDARRTVITHKEIVKIKKEDKNAIIPEDVVLSFSTDGIVKRTAASSIKVQKKNGVGLKSKTTSIVFKTLKANTTDVLTLFTTKGKMYRVLVGKIEAGANGIKLNSIVDLENDETVVAAEIFNDENPSKFIIFTTKKGLFKKSSIDEYKMLSGGRITKKGSAAIKLNEGDSIVDIAFVNEEEFILLTKKGMVIRFGSKEVNPIGKASKGVKAIKLAEDDEIIRALPIVNKTDGLFVISSDGSGKIMELEEIVLQTRYAKGTIVQKLEEGCYLAGAELLSKTSKVLLTGSSSSICLSAADLVFKKRTCVGTSLIKTPKVLAVSKM